MRASLRLRCGIVGGGGLRSSPAPALAQSTPQRRRTTHRAATDAESARASCRISACRAPSRARRTSRRSGRASGRRRPRLPPRRLRPRPRRSAAARSATEAAALSRATPAAAGTDRQTPPPGRAAARADAATAAPPIATGSAPAASFASGPPRTSLRPRHRGDAWLPAAAVGILVAGRGCLRPLRWRPASACCPGCCRAREPCAGGPRVDAFAVPRAPPPALPRPDAESAAAPTPPPEPSAPAVTPGCAASPRASSSPRLRPGSKSGSSPLRCVVDDDEVAIEFELELFKSGLPPRAPCSPRRACSTPAPTQEQEIAAFFAEPGGRASGSTSFRR